MGGAGPSVPQTERGRATRRALLDAAEEVFGEFNFEHASISEITRRAGVAQGTFYTYFTDKKAIFVELVRDLSHRMRMAMAQAAEDIEDRLEAERRGFRAFFEFIAEHRSVYRILRESEFVDAEVYRWHYRRLADGYLKGIMAAVENGQLPRDLDPEVAVYCLMGIGDFVGLRWAAWGGRVPDDVFDQMMEFVAAGLTGGVQS